MFMYFRIYKTNILYIGIYKKINNLIILGHLIRYLVIILLLTLDWYFLKDMTLKPIFTTIFEFGQIPCKVQI